MNKEFFLIVLLHSIFHPEISGHFTSIYIYVEICILHITYIFAGKNEAKILKIIHKICGQVKYRIYIANLSIHLFSRKLILLLQYSPCQINISLYLQASLQPLMPL